MANVTLGRDHFQLHVELTARPGRPLVVVGQSGAGKTTLLNLIAGVEVPDAGRIALGNDVWFEAAEARHSVPAHRRAIGYVAQHPTLFPHLTVEENVAFGLRASAVPRSPALEHARKALGELGIGELAGRKPESLSGGQRQRVTLARALCLDPKVLLLDEPLSSLDVSARQIMRAEIRRVLTRLRCVTIYVTHDPLEALSFGDHIAVVENGAVTQVGSRGELLRKPRSQYVGRFVGVNVFRGTVKAEPDSGVTHVEVGDVTLAVADAEGDGEMFVAIAPHNVTLSLEVPSGSARNVFEGKVEEVVPTLPLGDRVRVQLATNPPLVAEVTREAADGMRLEPGVVVYAAVKATGAEVYR